MSENEARASQLIRRSQAAARALEPFFGTSGRSQAEVGDLFVLPETAGSPLEWAVVLRHPVTSSRLLVVPADTYPVLGPTDVPVLSTSTAGPLSLRCGFAVWVSDALLRPALRTGRLDQEMLDRARRQCQGRASEAVEDSEADWDGADLAGWYQTFVLPGWTELTSLQNSLRQSLFTLRVSGQWSTVDGNETSSREAAALWEELRDLSYDQQRALIRTDRRFRSLGLCEKLCQQGLKAANWVEAQHLSELAILIYVPLALEKTGERRSLSELQDLMGNLFRKIHTNGRLESFDMPTLSRRSPRPHPERNSARPPTGGGRRPS